jgi:Ni/Fe-hydrogenase subunit HybB-like protein
MTDRETTLLNGLTQTTWRFYLWIAALTAVVIYGLIAYGYQLRYGLIVTGLRDQISWGVYIINFVFFIGISIAGTLISSVLRLTHANWRRSITRMAEAITLASLIVSVPMVVVDMGRPDRILNMFRYTRIQSPIVWDFLSVNTYLVACAIYFYLPLIPDVAILAQRPEFSAWRRKFYRWLSCGFKGTENELHLLEKSIGVMSVIVLPIAIATHTSLAWIFAMTLRPGWNSSIYGPYFVSAAIYSGCASVIVAMYVLRRVLHLEEYMKTAHFRNLGLMLVTFLLLYIYFSLNEYLTLGYKSGEGRELMQGLIGGDNALLFWGVQIFGIIIPVLLLITVLALKRYQEFTVAAVGLASGLAVIGAWAKRYLIVVPTLENPMMPSQGLPSEWLHYHPTWVEWALVAASAAAFMLIYTVLAKLFPMVSIWETRETETLMEETSPRKIPLSTAQPYMPPPIGMILIAVLLSTAVAARAEHAPSSKSGTPTVLSIEVAPVPVEDAPAAATAPADPARTSKRAYLMAEQAISPLLFGGERHEPEHASRPVAVTATLRDAAGAPVTYQTVGFALETTFGTHLQFGKVPTNDQGKARLVLKDHRCGVYPFQVVYGGGEKFQTSYATMKVDFGACPAPTLPASAILITPYATPPITLAFVFFYGIAWAVLAYSFGYLVLWRMRKEGMSGPVSPIFAE